MIGVTTYLDRVQTGVWDVPASFLPAVYFQGVTAAGGVAVLLPPQPVNLGIADRVLDGLDGLLITGGKDVDPAVYGQEPHPATDQPVSQRDAWEFALLRAALKRQLPVLGICRGAQVLNVALGGTLHQHLPVSSATADIARATRYSARCRYEQCRAPGWPAWSVNPSTHAATTIKPSPSSVTVWWSAAGMPTA